MEIGDTVVYIFDPYGYGDIKVIAIVKITRLANSPASNKYPKVVRTKILFGATMTTKEYTTNKEHLYEIGNPEVFRKIFLKRFVA